MQVKIKDLVKKYEGQTVLDIPTLEIQPGEVVGIAGNNGAGKTTLLRIILDLIGATHGSVELNGEKASKTSDWKKITGSFLDEGFLIEFLSPEELWHFTGKAYGMNKESILTRISHFERFTQNELNHSSKLIRQLSTGNKQKVGIINAMLAYPDFLILDEPFNFLDPTSQFIIRELLRDFNKKHGATQIISSHNINHLSEICTRIILLEKGKIIKDIEPQNKNLMQEIDRYFAELP